MSIEKTRQDKKIVDTLVDVLHDACDIDEIFDREQIIDWVVEKCTLAELVGAWLGETDTGRTGKCKSCKSVDGLVNGMCATCYLNNLNEFENRSRETLSKDRRVIT